MNWARQRIAYCAIVVLSVEDFSVARNKNCCAELQQLCTSPIHPCISCKISQLQVVVCYYKCVSWSCNVICCGQVQHFCCTNMKHFIVVDLHNTKCCKHVIQNLLCYTEKSPTGYHEVTHYHRLHSQPGRAIAFAQI